MAPRIVDAALAYAAYGLAVLPIGRNKHPIPEHGTRDSSKCQATICEWWRDHPQANVAVACGPVSGIWALDIDGDEGKSSLQQLVEQHGWLPLAPANITRSGFHLIFAQPSDGREPRNIVKRIAAGLDVRADGGCIVAPPSVHESRHVYHWARGRSIFDISAPPAPDWLLELACRRPEPKLPPAEYNPCSDSTWGPAPKYSKAALDAAARRIASAPVGQQDDTLNSESYAIGQLVAGGAMPRAFAADVLERAGMAMVNGNINRPWTVAVIREKIQRAFSDAKASPRCPESARRASR